MSIANPADYPLDSMGRPWKPDYAADTTQIVQDIRGNSRRITNTHQRVPMHSAPGTVSLGQHELFRQLGGGVGVSQKLIDYGKYGALDVELEVETVKDSNGNEDIIVRGTMTAGGMTYTENHRIAEDALRHAAQGSASIVTHVIERIVEDLRSKVAVVGDRVYPQEEAKAALARAKEQAEMSRRFTHTPENAVIPESAVKRAAARYQAREVKDRG